MLADSTPGGVPEAARRSLGANNPKRIGLELWNYDEAYGRYPPAYVADATGKPMHVNAWAT